ncbi:MAG: hypothetical protein K940chlam8_01031, partial [Chlamydiae bacterium]|nr:hypothetical protein [Chlamydiota bacterium]
MIFSLKPIYPQVADTAPLITKGFCQLNNLCQFLISRACISPSYETQRPIDDKYVIFEQQTSIFSRGVHALFILGILVGGFKNIKVTASILAGLIIGKGIGNHFNGQNFETLFQTAQYYASQLSEKPHCVDLSLVVRYYKESLLCIKNQEQMKQVVDVLRVLASENREALVSLTSLANDHEGALTYLVSLASENNEALVSLTNLANDHEGALTYLVSLASENNKALVSLTNLASENNEALEALHTLARGNREGA